MARSARARETPGQRGAQPYPRGLAGSGILDRRRAARQRGVEFTARGDLQFGEDVAKVPFHRACAQEQLRTDLGICSPLARELGYLLLLGSEFGAGGAAGSPTYLFARRLQLTLRALGEPVGAHCSQRLVCGFQLSPCVGAPVLAAQPFAVGEASTRQMNRHPSATEPLDCFSIELLGSFIFSDKRATSRGHRTCDLAAARRGDHRQSLGRGVGAFELITSS